MFLAHDNGFRRREHTYADVARASRAFAARLDAAGVRKGDTVVFWSENRPEWIAALWACLLQGVIVVPIDYRASADFLRRVAAIVKSRLVLIGEEVEASSLDGSGADVWRLDQLDWSATGTVERASVTRDDTAEIIFTSGATAEPKGVVITHRNVLANIVPGRARDPEVPQVRVAVRADPVPEPAAAVAHVRPVDGHLHPADAGRDGAVHPRLQPARHRPPHQGAPHLGAGVGAEDPRRPARAHPARGARSPPRCRLPASTSCGGGGDTAPSIARFGWKFWSFVVGAAPLDPALEEVWGRLGYAVIQGYGLTETAPIVSLNHPFSTSKGSVGKAIAGVEVRIAPDGEILVRGDNVTTGYFNRDAATAEAFEGGWFHTGDIGEVDAQGRLFIKGRKKEMIVTPEGLNVFPEDVERVVAGLAGVRDVAVVGARTGSEERVHAVVVLDPGIDPQAIVRQANLGLLDHQKIRGISVWPSGELPRTEGTRKLRRRELHDWLATGAAPRPSASDATSVAAIVAQFAGGRQVTSTTTLDELGLSSLERVELMAALEEKFGSTIDETAFANAETLATLEHVVPAVSFHDRGGWRDRRLPVVEPVLAGPRASATLAAHLDPAAGPAVRVDQGGWAGAPREH